MRCLAFQQGIDLFLSSSSFLVFAPDIAQVVRSNWKYVHLLVSLLDEVAADGKALRILEVVQAWLVGAVSL
jgi:hypothetical protein